MTKSVEDRWNNLDYAIQLLMRDLGDQSIFDVIFTPGGGDYDQILSTTWRELERQFIIKQRHRMSGHYQLTGYGWIIGLKVLGVFDSPELAAKAGKLSAALKAKVKGRNAEGFAVAEDLAHDSGLSVGFIRNAIESELLQKLFNIYGARWISSGRGKFISVPLEFGQTRL